MKHLVILGNGITGITVARHVRKQSDMKITIISAESQHFFSRTALMYIFMGHMKYEDTKPYEDFFWEKNRIDLIHGFVNEVNCSKKCLGMDDGGKSHMMFWLWQRDRRVIPFPGQAAIWKGYKVFILSRILACWRKT